jgi:hypothetical protein
VTSHVDRTHEDDVFAHVECHPEWLT